MGLLQNTLCRTIKRVFSVILLVHFLLALSCWELSIPLKYQQTMVNSHGTCNNGDEDEMITLWNMHMSAQILSPDTSLNLLLNYL